MDETYDSNSATGEAPQGEFPDDLYRKWFKTANAAGFLTVAEALEIGRFSIDIGALTGENKVQSFTRVWVPAVGFATFLKAVRDGRATVTHPANAKAGLTHNGNWIYYGGSTVDGKPVSRILKIAYWGDNPGTNDPYGSTAGSGGFQWKAGMFAATKTATGAYNPDMNSPISSNLIKVSLTEMAEISYRLDLSLGRHALRSETWLAELSGKKKK